MQNNQKNFNNMHEKPEKEIPLTWKVSARKYWNENNNGNYDIDSKRKNQSLTQVRNSSGLSNNSSKCI